MSVPLLILDHTLVLRCLSKSIDTTDSVIHWFYVFHSDHSLSLSLCCLLAHLQSFPFGNSRRAQSTFCVRLYGVFCNIALNFVHSQNQTDHIISITDVCSTV